MGVPQLSPDSSRASPIKPIALYRREGYRQVIGTAADRALHAAGRMSDTPTGTEAPGLFLRLGAAGASYSHRWGRHSGPLRRIVGRHAAEQREGAGAKGV